MPALLSASGPRMSLYMRTDTCAFTHAHTSIAARQHNVQQLGSTAHAGDCHYCRELCCTLYIHVSMMRVMRNTRTRPAVHCVMP